MLENFIYLNEPALDSYLSALEDGLRGSVEAKTAKTSSVSGKLGVTGVGIGGDHERQQEETTSRTDTAAARFERQQRLAREDVEASGWVDVVDPESDLSGLGTGALIELECEVYVPEIIKMLSPGGGLAKAVDQIQALTQIAPAFGSQLTGMPEQGQLDAMKGFASALGGDAVFVGEPDGTDRRVAGKLLDQYLNVEVEGFARVVGKVSAQWGKGQWKPLVVLVVQNSVDASMIGTATSTNNYFREVGASLGVAVFGTIFTSRLTENLKEVFTSAGASAEQAGISTATLDPQTLSQLPDSVRDGVVTAYADALAPVFWYLLPFIGIAFVLSLFLKQIPLSDVAGLVARGEAIGGEEAEALEAAQRGTVRSPKDSDEVDAAGKAPHGG